MNLRNTIALSFAAALLAGAGSASAATTHTMMHKPMRHAMHTRAHGTMHAAPAGADHSADSLNAQSLSNAQGAQ